MLLQHLPPGSGAARLLPRPAGAVRHRCRHRRYVPARFLRAQRWANRESAMVHTTLPQDVFVWRLYSMVCGSLGYAKRILRGQTVDVLTQDIKATCFVFLLFFYECILITKGMCAARKVIYIYIYIYIYTSTYVHTLNLGNVVKIIGHFAVSTSAYTRTCFPNRYPDKGIGYYKPMRCQSC